MLGKIFNVQDFCTDDGPGIRTTVFLKGCPLRCAWCHNPESRYKENQILFDEKTCMACGKCIEACPQKAHTFQEKKHLFQREICQTCGKCALVCPTESLKLCGKDISAQEIVDKILPNLPFYQKSGGGLTISGGEPLFQPQFTLELCQLSQKQGIQVCVETCGYGNLSNLLDLIPYVQFFLFDFKMKKDAEKYIGVSGELILENLSALSEAGGKIILRCPIIPEVNFTKEHFDDICEIAIKNKGIEEIQLLAYHPLGIEKAKGLNATLPYANPVFLDKNLLLPYAEKLENKTKKKATVI